MFVKGMPVFQLAQSRSVLVFVPAINPAKLMKDLLAIVLSLEIHAPNTMVSKRMTR